jgi:hypothetical protein
VNYTTVEQLQQQVPVRRRLGRALLADDTLIVIVRIKSNSSSQAVDIASVRDGEKKKIKTRCGRGLLSLAYCAKCICLHFFFLSKQKLPHTQNTLHKSPTTGSGQ